MTEERTEDGRPMPATTPEPPAVDRAQDDEQVADLVEQHELADQVEQQPAEQQPAEPEQVAQPTMLDAADLDQPNG